jgi:glutamate-ammonia-ligase adenylyltransferase
VTAEIRAVLSLKRDAKKLLSDTAGMRAKLRHEFGSENLFAIKHARGGLVDIEFIWQYLQLRHAAGQPEILETGAAEALTKLCQHGVLPACEAAELGAAVQLMTNIQTLLRLCLGNNIREEQLPKALKKALCSATGMADFEALKQRLGAAKEIVTSLYRKYIETPAKTLAKTSTSEGDDHAANR